MLSNPAAKYRPFPAINLADRQWPNRTLSAAPIWMSTDLRDGNQALFEPMNAERKMRLFHTLCDIGFKEIEIAFPSASQTDFDFVRQLIEGGHVPRRRDDRGTDASARAAHSAHHRIAQGGAGGRSFMSITPRPGRFARTCSG
jgi:hypothetical protein